MSEHDPEPGQEGASAPQPEESAEQDGASEEQLTSEEQPDQPNDLDPSTVVIPAADENTDLPAEFDDSFNALLAHVERSAEGTPSASSKARALLIASELQEQLGERELAQQRALDACEMAPKMALGGLQARGLGASDAEKLERILENTVRLAPDHATRTHAALQLAHRQRRSSVESGRSSETVLDRLARAGEEDPRVLLERCIGRLSQGESTAGTQIPETLAPAIPEVAELLGGARTQTPSLAVLLHRAARSLASGRPEEATTLLKSAPLEKATTQELHAGLVATDPRRQEEAKRLYLELVAEAPTRATVRHLAATCLATDDRKTLATLLGKVDPSRGIFQPWEQLLLLSLTGAAHGLSEQQASSLQAAEPTTRLLGLALSPRLTPWERQEGSLAELRLGEVLASLARHEAEPGAPSESSKDETPPARLGLLDEAIALCEELSGEESEEPQLAALLRYEVALLRRDPQGRAEALNALAAEGRPFFLLAAAMLHEAEGEPDAAAALYRNYQQAAEALLDDDNDATQLGVQSASTFVRDTLTELTGDAATAAKAPATDATSSPTNWLKLGRHLAALAQDGSGTADRLNEESSLVTQLAAVLAASSEGSKGALPPSARPWGDHEGRSSLSAADEALTLLTATFRALHTDASPAGPLELEAARTLSEELLELSQADQTGSVEALIQSWGDEETRSKALENSSTNSSRPQATSGEKESVQAAPDTWAGAFRVAASATSAEIGQRASGLLAFGKAHPGSALRDLGEAVCEIDGDYPRLTQAWVERAQAAESPEERREAYRRLVQLDGKASETADSAEDASPAQNSSAVLWLRTLVEEFPDDLPALLSLEGVLLSSGRTEEWPRLRDKIAAALPESDRPAYLQQAATDALARHDLRRAGQSVGPLLGDERPPLLALRIEQSAARAVDDQARLSAVSQKLLAGSSTDLDQLALTMALAVAAARAGDTEEARRWADQALEVRPDDFGAQLLRLNLLKSPDATTLAEGLEALAEASSVQRHQAKLFLAAGRAWQDAGEAEHASHCFEKTLAADSSSLEAFEKRSEFLEARLAEADASADHDAQKKSAAEEDATALPRQALKSLIELRLDVESSSTRKLALRLRLARLLAELGQPEDAKMRLERALAEHPESIEALMAHAEVSARLGDHASAEHSLVSLRDRLPAGDHRTRVLKTLGGVYEQHLQSPEKAMDAYEAVHADEPDDLPTANALVRVYAKLQLAERATNLQTAIIQKSESSSDKRKGALLLARLYEDVAGDARKASATLERTRRAWPLDAEVLEAMALFMDRKGESSARRMMVARAGKEARRKLEAKRIDPALLDTLARVAALSDQPDEAATITQARAAYLGEDSSLKGAGVKCLQSNLEGALAPQILSPAIRTLLRKTGAAMDAAFPIDLNALAAKKLSDGPIVERVAGFAQALQISPPEVYSADSLGSRCLPLTSAPPRLIVGAGLAELPPETADYLILRALKLVGMGAGALARSRPEDGWSMFAALLHLFSPGWKPAKVEARKLAQAKALIEQGLARSGYDEDVPTLALEAIGSLPDDGAEVAEAPRLLANRVGLLGSGSLGAALAAMSSGEKKPLPASGPSRFRWIDGHQEAKDLVLFATSDEFSHARQLVGLVAKRSGGPPVPGAADAPPAAPQRGSRGPSLPGAPPRKPPPRRR